MNVALEREQVTTLLEIVESQVECETNQPIATVLRKVGEGQPESPFVLELIGIRDSLLEAIAWARS